MTRLFVALPSHQCGARMGLVMGSLSPRLQVRVSQKQILTPGLVQMVSLLQLNRLELKDMISAEIAQNPVLEEAAEGGEELTPEELQPLLEAEAALGRSGRPVDSGSDRRSGGSRWVRRRLRPPMVSSRQIRCDECCADRGTRRSERVTRRWLRLPETPEAQGRRSVRRNRLRIVLRRLSGPGLQEPGF